MNASRLRFRPAPGEHHLRGQALAEGVVVLALLATLYWAIPVLGRYQDMVLSSTQASRHAAFLASRDDTAEGQSNAVIPGFSLAWRDHRGEALVTQAPALEWHRLAPSASLQPAGLRSEVEGLYSDWHLTDRGVLVTNVSVRARDLVSDPGRTAGLLRFQGHTALLTQAGHAVDDADVSRRIAAGRSGWGQAYGLSVTTGRSLAGRLRETERGWGRPAPDFDWLTSWDAKLPQDRLRPRGQS